MALKTAFAQEVLQGRKRLKLTQQQVGDAAAISVRWYQQIEKGTFLPSSTVMLRLILLLQVDVHKLSEEVETHGALSVLPH